MPTGVTAARWQSCEQRRSDGASGSFSEVAFRVSKAPTSMYDSRFRSSVEPTDAERGEMTGSATDERQNGCSDVSQSPSQADFAHNMRSLRPVQVPDFPDLDDYLSLLRNLASPQALPVASSSDEMRSKGTSVTNGALTARPLAGEPVGQPAVQTDARPSASSSAQPSAQAAVESSRQAPVQSDEQPSAPSSGRPAVQPAAQPSAQAATESAVPRQAESAEVESLQAALLERAAEIDELRRRLEQREADAPVESEAAPAQSRSSRRLSASEAMAEVARISEAASPAEVLGIDDRHDAADIQRAWKQLVFGLHPDRLVEFSEDERGAAAGALHAVQRAREELRESAQASGQVEVPGAPLAAGRPVCTRNVPGQRRWELNWELPPRDDTRPVEKYEVYGPRIFSHEGEPMEWHLLATLPKLEATFIFVEESPAQQEVMQAGDRVRSPTVPLTVYAVNGRGRSEALYIHLPWVNKFPWLSQGFPSMLCRQCCAVLPKYGDDKESCAACSAWITPSAAAVHIHCPKCRGEALWDTTGTRLDCRLCGKHLAVNPNDNHRPAAGKIRSNGNEFSSAGNASGRSASAHGGSRSRQAPDSWGRR